MVQYFQLLDLALVRIPLLQGHADFFFFRFHVTCAGCNRGRQGLFIGGTRQFQVLGNFHISLFVALAGRLLFRIRQLFQPAIALGMKENLHNLLPFCRRCQKQPEHDLPELIVFKA